MSEEPVTFQSGANRLSGMLHRPDGAPSDVAVLFVHSGARGRLGSTFQYPVAARALAKKGIASMRWDPSGMGDSEGRIDDTKMLDFFGSIQAGCFVADTLAAIEELDRQVAPKKLVLWGLCGGGITALLAAPRAKRKIDGLVLLSTPVLLDSAQQSPLETISAEHAASHLWTLYAKKLLSLEAYKRLFRMESDIETIKTYATAFVKGTAKKIARKVKNRIAPPPPDAPARPLHPRQNPHYLEALSAMVQKDAKLLMLYGETDSLRYDFWNEVYEPLVQKDEAYGKRVEVHLVEGCNHLFTLREWQAAALRHFDAWLPKVATP
ncbi:MAG: alpha/beta fold hydrolase [Polyangiaceae bacterium]|nr:alpha/beta fold hydrolase [Polyangiaceae bacterium]